VGRSCPRVKLEGWLASWVGGEWRHSIPSSFGSCRNICCCCFCLFFLLPSCRLIMLLLILGLTTSIAACAITAHLDRENDDEEDNDASQSPPIFLFYFSFLSFLSSSFLSSSFNFLINFSLCECRCEVCCPRGRSHPPAGPFDNLRGQHRDRVSRRRHGLRTLPCPDTCQIHLPNHLSSTLPLLSNLIRSRQKKEERTSSLSFLPSSLFFFFFPVLSASQMSSKIKIGHYILGETLGVGTFGKVKGEGSI